MTIKTEIRNYYEDLVVDWIVEAYRDQGLTTEEFNDVACLALNKLPARYYRHSVDMAFFLTGADLKRMRGEVEEAVSEAARYVLSHRDEHQD